MGVAAEMIGPGDRFYNPKRGNCVKVESVHGEFARCLSWQPGGWRGSITLRIHTETLLTSYERVQAIYVQTDKERRTVYGCGGE